MKFILVFLVFATLILIFKNKLFASGSSSGVSSDASVHSFSVKTIDAQEKKLADFDGKALLIVNTASRCGFTPQYNGLETLYQKYRDKGFEILAFPANNFLAQEPGTDTEIKEFCSLKFKTTFPLFSKISVKGKDIHPLYQFLTTQTPFKGGVTWNFNKFLTDRKGKVIARFGSQTDPLDQVLVKKIEEALA